MRDQWRQIVLHDLPYDVELDREIGATSRLRIPMISAQRMSGCLALVYSLTRDAASPMISTAFRMAN